MAKIVGIDLGTTYSAVSIWDDKRKIPFIIPNLRGNNTTPSIVSVNKDGQLVVGEDARQNLWANPDDTVSEAKREMGENVEYTMQGKRYNPQMVSAAVLGYLKRCAEQYLGEEVHDAVITVPAYFKEVQIRATRDAGMIAGFNVHRLINEPTAAAIAYGVSKRGDDEQTEEKTYAVYDLGGGTFDVSIIEVTAEDITVIGTGGDMRLGGLDMDEAVMKWALREIQKQYGVDLRGDENVKRRLKVEAEDIKKMLVISETATLNVPFLTVINDQPLNIELHIDRLRFEMLISPLLTRAIHCLEEAVASAEEKNQKGWADLDGILLVGGPTRIPKIRSMLTELLREKAPDKEQVVLTDINPDEVVAMGAAIVAAGLKPIGKPPEQVETMSEDEIESAKEEAEEEIEAPAVDIYDVTGHSLGIAVGRERRFQKIIEKETEIPISQAQTGFSNEADYTRQLLVEVFQGEDDFVAANTKIGEVKIEGLEPLPRGQQILEVKFNLDVSGTLSTVCTDLRTGKTYEGSFVFDGITRMSAEEIKAKRVMLRQMFDSKPTPAAAQAPPSAGQPASPPPPSQAPATPAAIPALNPNAVPEDFRVFWLECMDLLPTLEPRKASALAQAMTSFAQAVAKNNPDAIEEAGWVLPDALYEAKL